MNNRLRKYVFSLPLLIALFHLGFAQNQVLVEAESFDKTGGWVVDQQSFPVIHSSYLMAHGMGRPVADATRSEEHTSELQSLMRISYAVFCLTKQKHTNRKCN